MLGSRNSEPVTTMLSLLDRDDAGAAAETGTEAGAETAGAATVGAAAVPTAGVRAARFGTTQ